MKLKSYLSRFFDISKIFIKNNLYGCLIFLIFFLSGIILGLSISGAGIFNNNKNNLILLYDYRYFSVFFEFAITFLIGYLIILISSFNKITLYLSTLITFFYSYKLGLTMVIYPQILGVMGFVTIIFILIPLYIFSIIILYLSVLNLINSCQCASLRNFTISKICFKKNLLKLLKFYLIDLGIIFLYTILFAWVIVILFYSV